jgi:hypothetical protein
VNHSESAFSCPDRLGGQAMGPEAGLALAIVTDLLAVAILKPLHIKAAVETLIISLFVITGAKLASWITATFFLESEFLSRESLASVVEFPPRRDYLK